MICYRASTKFGGVLNTSFDCPCQKKPSNQITILKILINKLNVLKLYGLWKCNKLKIRNN